MTLSFFSHLSISEVATSDGSHSTLHPLNNNYRLESVPLRIQKTIKDCGNSVDTYYKQKRMGKISGLPPMDSQISRRAVKFYRAQEWKARIKGYIDDFKKYRVQLQEILSLHCVGRQSPRHERHEDERFSITVIRNKA